VYCPDWYLIVENNFRMESYSNVYFHQDSNQVLLKPTRNLKSWVVHNIRLRHYLGFPKSIANIYVVHISLSCFQVSITNTYFSKWVCNFKVFWPIRIPEIDILQIIQTKGNKKFKQQRKWDVKYCNSRNMIFFFSF